MKWRERRKLLDHIPAMETAKLLECLKTEDDNPLLQGIIHVLKGLEEIAKENASVASQGAEERAFFTGAMAAHGEAQERICDLVSQAREKAVGKK